MLEERRCPVCGETYLPLVETCKKDNTPLVVTSTLINKVLDQRYKLDRILGYGGMGVVYHATHVRTNQERAVKVLHPEMMEKEGMLQRFQTEAIAAAKIDNDKAVKIVDFQVTEEKLAYLVMEMVEGVVLRKLIAPQGMEYQRAIEIICQICEAVHAAHEKKIIHRDLKPDNVIVRRSGNEDCVKVLDFGIAKLRQEAETDSPNAPLTKVGTIMGTPHYMSPEQCRGIRSEDLKPASDVYSLGIIAYEMLCGRVPFDGTNILELIDKHKNEPPEHIRSVNSAVPISVANVVMRTLAKMPEDRWNSAEKLAQELRIALREARGGKTQPGEPVITEIITGSSKTTPLDQFDFGSDTKEPERPEPGPVPKPTPKPVTSETDVTPKPNWLMIALAAAAVVLLAGLIYWAVAPKRDQKPPESEGSSKTISDEFGEMALIPGGAFMMGSNTGEDDEIPVHSVTVKDFYLDKYEVTNQQYKKFVDATKHPAPKPWVNGMYAAAEGLFPVTYVTWNDAVAYAKWAKKRLPTEAEWEYAARSGKNEFAFPWGAVWKDGYANVGRGRSMLMPVGGYPNDHNEAGVFDLAGNVSEWVADNYRTYNGATDDSCAGCKVFRGGNMVDGIKDSRATKRWNMFPDVPQQYAAYIFPRVGFRCARDSK